MGEIIFLLIVAAISLCLFGLSFGFQSSIIDKSGGPALFPRIVVFLLLVILVIRMITILRNPEEKKKTFHFLEMFMGSRLYYIIVFTLYIIVVRPLGFIISSSLFLAILIPYLYTKQYGVRPTKKRIIITTFVVIISITVLYLLFTRYFNVLLPSGILNI